MLLVRWNCLLRCTMHWHVVIRGSLRARSARMRCLLLVSLRPDLPFLLNGRFRSRHGPLCEGNQVLPLLLRSGVRRSHRWMLCLHLLHLRHLRIRSLGLQGHHKALQMAQRESKRGLRTVKQHRAHENLRNIHSMIVNLINYLLIQILIVQFQIRTQLIMGDVIRNSNFINIHVFKILQKCNWNVSDHSIMNFLIAMPIKFKLYLIYMMRDNVEAYRLLLC